MVQNPNYRLIARLVKEKRMAMKMTQAQLAELVDLSTRFISHIETGRKKASLNSLFKIAVAFDTTLDVLTREK